MRKTLTLNIFSFAVLAFLTTLVLSGEPSTGAEAWLGSQLAMIQNPTLNEVVIFITNIGDALTLSIFSLILLAAFRAQKKLFETLLLIFGMAGGVMLEILVKLAIQRPRPEDALLEITSYSFPSGHATMTTIFFSIIILAFHKKIKSRLIKISFITANILMILLISFSRIYLNVHWLNDVLAGFALGIFWLTFTILILKKLNLAR